mgnify:CR=1 FL=1
MLMLAQSNPKLKLILLSGLITITRGLKIVPIERYTKVEPSPLPLINGIAINMNGF